MRDWSLFWRKTAKTAKNAGKRVKTGQKWRKMARKRVFLAGFGWFGAGLEGAGGAVEGLSFGAGEGLDALGADFVEDAVDFGLVGGRGGVAGGGGALGDIVAQAGPETAQVGALEELVYVEEAGEGAGEVGGVGDAGGLVAAGEHEFDEGEAGDELPGHHGDGEDEEDEEGEAAAGIEGGEGGENAVNGAGRADAEGAGGGGEPDPAEAAEDAADEIHGEEMPGTHGALGFGAQEVEGEHVEEQVHESAMQEHIGEGLPDHAGEQAVAREGQGHPERRAVEQPKHEEDGDVGLDEVADYGRQVGEESRPALEEGVVLVPMGHWWSIILHLRGSATLNPAAAPLAAWGDGCGSLFTTGRGIG